MGDLKREKEFTEAALDSQKADLTSEKRKNIALAEQLKDRDKRIKEIQGELDLVKGHLNIVGASNRSSPTSTMSMNGSITDSHWPVSCFES